MAALGRQLARATARQASRAYSSAPAAPTVRSSPSAAVSAIDLAAVRADTPSCATRAHLNAAGSSPPPARALRAHVEHLLLEAELGGYAAAAAAAPALVTARASVATLLNASAPSEIAWADSSSRAFALAVGSVALRPGDVMLSVGDGEYGANAVALLHHAARHGATVRALPSTADGSVDLPGLRAALGAPRVRAVCLTHVPSNGGAVADAAAVGAVLRACAPPAEHGGPVYLLDACQSVGQLAVDVRAIGCDFAASCGRKWLRAPRGTAFLYARGALVASGALGEPPMLDHTSAAWLPAAAGGGLGGYAPAAGAARFELWEGAVGARLALGAAVDYALGLGLDAIERAVRARAALARAELGALPGVRLADLAAASDGGRGLSGIVALDVEALGGAAAVHGALERARVMVGTSHPATTALDTARRGLPPLLRVSAHYFADDADLARLAAELRSLSDRAPARRAAASSADARA